jgi:signal transduction histidine kinase/ActR/RegA family two-component response regulator
MKFNELYLNEKYGLGIIVVLLLSFFFSLYNLVRIYSEKKINTKTNIRIESLYDNIGHFKKELSSTHNLFHSVGHLDSSSLGNLNDKLNSNLLKIKNEIIVLKYLNKNTFNSNLLTLNNIEENLKYYNQELNEAANKVSRNRILSNNKNNINLLYVNIQSDSYLLFNEIRKMHDQKLLVFEDNLINFIWKVIISTLITITSSIILLIYYISNFNSSLRKVETYTSQISNGNIEPNFELNINKDFLFFINSFQNLVKKVKENEDEITNKKMNLEKLVSQRAEELVLTNEKLQKEISIRLKIQESLLKNQMTLNKAIMDAKAASSAKSEFIANMSHEIRTPMNSILGFSEILKEKLINPDFQNYLGGITNSGKALLSIINSILDFSKLDAGKIEVKNTFFNLKELVSEVISMFEDSAIKKDLKLFVNYSEGMPENLYFDADKLRHILINLLSNAIKFTNEGQVDLDFKYTPIPKFKRFNLIIEIKDTGIGINALNLSKVFEPFYQVDSSISKKFSGTGLGLSITKRFIDILSGKIDVNSQVGHGTKFTIELPNLTYSNQKNSNLSNKAKNLNYQFNQDKILIIDSDINNLEIVSVFLSGLNLITKTIQKIDESFPVIKSWVPNIVIIELPLQYDSVLEYIKGLKHLYPNMVFIGVTTFTFDNDQTSEIHLIINHIITKPITKNNLISILSEELVYNLDSIEELNPIKIERNWEFALNKFPVDKIKSFYALLVSDSKSKWEKANSTMMIHDISDFANELLNLSKEFTIDIMKEYANDLEESTKSIDIERIEMLMKEFELLIQVTGRLIK